MVEHVVRALKESEAMDVNVGRDETGKYIEGTHASLRVRIYGEHHFRVIDECGDVTHIFETQNGTISVGDDIVITTENSNYVIS